jgi:hypothetical protein
MDLAATFSNIAVSISQQFGGPYHPGKVIDQIDAIYDDGGSISTPGTVSLRDCMVQVDIATEAMRQSEGYAEGDARFLILDSRASTARSTRMPRFACLPGRAWAHGSSAQSSAMRWEFIIKGAVVAPPQENNHGRCFRINPRRIGSEPRWGC